MSAATNSWKTITNLPPDVWGRKAWQFIHAIALSYPHQPSLAEKTAMRNLFNSLQLLLPCDKCKHNFSAELIQHPLEPALQSKTALNTWLLAVHNSVSKRLGKPTMAMKDLVSYVYDSSGNTMGGGARFSIDGFYPNGMTPVAIGLLVGMIIFIILFVITLVLYIRKIKRIVWYNTPKKNHFAHLIYAYVVTMMMLKTKLKIPKKK